MIGDAVLAVAKFDLLPLGGTGTPLNDAMYLPPEPGRNQIIIRILEEGEECCLNQVVAQLSN